LTESLVELSRGSREALLVNSCPECGSFLDAPRTHPGSGDLARKCSSCRDWYPVANGNTDSPE
jgi:DNA-directed RNA polymerase subunit M/transcription elongation factor TFIIS